MFLTMDNTFKRAIFIAIVIAINIIFAYTAFFYQPDLNQKFIFIYLVIIQALVFATFFIYRDSTTARIIQPKRLKNPRLQENAFEFSTILLKEYDYIKETASQAMNDRHTMVNYFLIITGVVISIIGSKAINLWSTTVNPATVSVLIALSIFLNIIGWIYFMHLIRLRQAWRGSAEAMNQIKEFFIVNGRVPDDIARSAMLWDSRTAPRAGKKSNVYYYSTMLISLVSTAAVFFASWLLFPEAANNSISLFTCFIALYHFIFQIQQNNTTALLLC